MIREEHQDSDELHSWEVGAEASRAFWCVFLQPHEQLGSGEPRVVGMGGQPDTESLARDNG